MSKSICTSNVKNPFSGMHNPFSGIGNPLSGMSNPFSGVGGMSNPLAGALDGLKGIHVKNPLSGLGGIKNPFKNIHGPDMSGWGKGWGGVKGIGGLSNPFKDMHLPHVDGFKLPHINLSGIKMPHVPGLPSMNFKGLLSCDLPSLHMFNGFKAGKLPSFTMGKINLSHSHGTLDKFKLSLGKINDPFGGSMSMKQNIKDLNGENCGDADAKINTPESQKNVLKAALKVNNCSVDDHKACEQANEDMKNLGIKNPLSNTVMDAVVDDKFDVSKASSLFGSPAMLTKVTESIGKSRTPLNKLLKAGKKAHLIKDKSPMIGFVNKVTDPKALTSFNKSPMLTLINKANKDMPSKYGKIPTGKVHLGVSEKLDMLHRASLKKNEGVGKYKDLLKNKSKASDAYNKIKNKAA